jgi:hypothetical protein
MTKSDFIKDKKKMSFLSFTDEDEEGGVLVVRAYMGGLTMQLKGYYIEYYDTNLKLQKSYDYKYKGDKYIKGAFIKNGKVHLLELAKGKKNQVIVQAQTASLSDFKFETKQLVSFTDRNSSIYFGMNKFSSAISGLPNAGRTGKNVGNITWSKNQQYFSFAFDIREQYENLHTVFVFNNELEKVFENTVSKDKLGVVGAVADVAVDDENGNVYYILATAKKKSGFHFSYDLVKVSVDDIAMVSLKDIDPEIDFLKLGINDQNAYALGVYGDGEDAYLGFCTFRLNKQSWKIEQKSFPAFSEQFILDKYGSESKRKKNIIMLNLKTPLFTDNGDIVLNGEEITEAKRVAMRGAMPALYDFSNIWSARFDSAGNLLWSRNIPKRQSYIFNPMVGLSNVSYSSIATDDATHFIFNTSDRIKKDKDGRIIFKSDPNKSNLYLLTVNGNAEVTYEELLNFKNSKTAFMVMNGLVNVKNNTVVLVGKKKKQTQVLKLKL